MSDHWSCWSPPGVPKARYGSPPRKASDGEPYLGIGTPGGDQQDQWTLATFLRHVHHSPDLQAAIDMPLFTSRHFPQSFYPRGHEPGRLVVEARFGEATIDALWRRGHRITVEGDWALGRVCAAGRRDGFLVAAATPRQMQAYAVGR